MNIREMFREIQPRYRALKERVAVITGAGRGVGKGIAARLGKEGMRIVVNDKRYERAEATAKELRELGVNALAIEADVGKVDEVDRLFDATIKKYKKVELLVNNAAYVRRFSLFEPKEEEVDVQIAVNIKGLYMCSYKVASIMKEVGGGNIVNISSVGGLRAHWEGILYDGSKGAVDAMTRAMSLELSKYGIRVNAIAPGAVCTERTKGTRGLGEVVKRIPLKRLCCPHEIGGVVAFLASEDAGYITGQVVYVDGGISAQLHPPGQPI